MSWFPYSKWKEIAHNPAKQASSFPDDRECFHTAESCKWSLQGNDQQCGALWDREARRVIAAHRRRSSVCSCRLSLVANYDLLEGGKQSSQDNPAEVIIFNKFPFLFPAEYNRLSSLGALWVPVISHCSYPFLSGGCRAQGRQPGARLAVRLSRGSSDEPWGRRLSSLLHCLWELHASAAPPVPFVSC